MSVTMIPPPAVAVGVATPREVMDIPPPAGAQLCT